MVCQILVVVCSSPSIEEMVSGLVGVWVRDVLTDFGSVFEFSRPEYSAGSPEDVSGNSRGRRARCV